MKKGPEVFSHFGEISKESLTKDYLFDQKFSISTATVAGVAIRSTATDKRGLSTVDFGALKVQYFHQHVTLTSTVSLNKAPTINVSATIGTPTLAIGANAAYRTSSCKFKNIAVGINFNRKDSTASLILGDNGDTIRALYMHSFNVLEKTAVAAEITRRLSTNKTKFVVGGCYGFDDQTLVKAKVDNNGKLGAVLQHKFIYKSLVSLSTEVNTKALHRTPKFGLALALKP
ncbi:mitochondrial outer membrane protein porin 2-like [Bidens hawaiensis]|uniref:mitochondrial outer membrane protein porin 2-like n=1 Tax=Bidens hawaiensis TaxID=980011 RepID=UPI00404B60CA